MILRTIYRALRSLVFSVTLFVVGVFVLAYVLISIPAVTNLLKIRIGHELSQLTGGTVEIGSLQIFPFNEVRIHEIILFDPQGEKCLEIETLGGGISLWKLITSGDIEISYGEIIGLKADLIQKEEGGPLNIQFLIDNLSSKEEKKEKTPFKLELRNVVLRKSELSFERPWLENKKIGSIDLSSLHVTDLAADLAFPVLSDKEIKLDLRRLSFLFENTIKVEKLGLKGLISPQKIKIDNFILEFPLSRIYIPEIDFDLPEDNDLKRHLETERQELLVTDSYIVPSEFSFLSPLLKDFSEPLALNIDLEGNLREISVKDFSMGNPQVFQFNLAGTIDNPLDLEQSETYFPKLSLWVDGQTFKRLSSILPSLPLKVHHIFQNLGNFSLSGEIEGSMPESLLQGNLELASNSFHIEIEGAGTKFNTINPQFEGELTLQNLDIQTLLPEIPINNLNANIVADAVWKEKGSEGNVSLVLEDLIYKGKYYEGLSLNLTRTDSIVSGDFMMHNSIGDIETNFRGALEKEDKEAELNMIIERLDLSEIIDMKKYSGYIISGNINLSGHTQGLNNVSGELSLTDFEFSSSDASRSLKLKNLTIDADIVEKYQTIDLQSDWINARAEGEFKISDLIPSIKNMIEGVVPAFIPPSSKPDRDLASDMEFDIHIKKNNTLPEFLNLPFRLLVPVNISGLIDGQTNTASLTVDVPYLQQGKDKLIYDSKVYVSVDGSAGSMDALIETTLPVKNGDLNLNVNIFGQNNNFSTDLHWVNTENSDFKGHLSLDTGLGKNPSTSKPEITLEIKPSVLDMGTAIWNVSNSIITYSDKYATIQGLRIWHDDQFVEIEGVASPEYADEVKVSLADIDVDYVFNMLQINYVTFGGTATGEVAGHALFSGNPVAETESFVIRDFTYNGCPLGTCLATSRWNNQEKEIEITADISKDDKRVVYGKGGIWLTQDSLCFDIQATKVPVDFVQPFMEVFSSHVGGFATGDVKLFGNFHDIDMTGKIFADSVAVKLDYTNTIYHGSDTVYLNPGKIEIPHFTLYDKFGNSAQLSGELTHRFFHDPSFTFRLADADNFLCYDTSAELNPDWYGVLFGTGSALLKGVPGLVDISADMTVGGNSNFTFVLNETEYARDYQFLTFSDKRKEIQNEDRPLTANDFKEMLKKKMSDDQQGLSKFGIDIRATVTPQVLFTLVMDPAAGDKITARGKGAMQMKYESDVDELMMYGKYEIEEGNYNFSLQDIILRDFKIKEGSYISFNGNPLNADLEISATYRVNTNLSDLDKSFSTDRDLNRTNVPVDAVLSVNGNMQNPDITFDIELPTLTQDVERKVKSIISTDDMMNRQIIYLLALNRFYTPEYMGATGNGGELAAVASSTISSQLSNILGQLTDKVSVAPSFRSDKGDFSDIEVDVALSSRLLNNRLLINGNFGYRDRSTSSTTFVGDFDVEYLLSKNGNLRLKAYNHFNDQNYYLREALTTQGLGIVYRKDFDDWFKFLRKKKDPEEDNSSETDILQHEETKISDSE